MENEKDVYLKTLYNGGVINLFDICPNPVLVNCKKDGNKIIPTGEGATCKWIIPTDYLENPISFIWSITYEYGSDVHAEFAGISYNNNNVELMKKEGGYYCIKDLASITIHFADVKSFNLILNKFQFIQTPTQKWVNTIEKFDPDIVSFESAPPTYAGTINDNSGLGKKFKLISTKKPGVSQLILETDDYKDENSKVRSELTVYNRSNQYIVWSEDDKTGGNKNITYYRDPSLDTTLDDFIDLENKNNSYYAFSKYGYYGLENKTPVMYKTVWINTLSSPESSKIPSGVYVFDKGTNKWIKVGELIKIIL